MPTQVRELADELEDLLKASVASLAVIQRIAGRNAWATLISVGERLGDVKLASGGP